MMRWLADYAVAMALGTVLVLVTLWGGFAAGIWAGPGANAAIAQNYASGLQAKWEADTKKQVGDLTLQFARERAALQQQIAETEATARAQRTADHARWADDANAYSERILGLQLQLRAHGIREVVVQP